MNAIDDPGNGLLAVPLRTNSVLQARVRVAQFRELATKRRSFILRGLMFIHLKKDLQVKPKDWIDCADPQDSSDQVGVSPLMLKLLSVASALAFKIWKLSRPLRASAISLAVISAALLGWYCWANWNNPIVTLNFGEPGENLWRVTWGHVALAVIAMTAINRLPAFARNVLRLVDYRKTAYEIIVGAGMGILGWFVAQFHLRFFDKLYLWWGSQKRFLDSENKQPNR